MEQQPEHTKGTQPEHSTQQRPSVWVGSWLDYNDGRLHGCWLDAARDAAVLERDIAAMLAASPTARATGQLAEDRGIFDADGFGTLNIGEQASLTWVSAVAQGIAKHGAAFAAYAALVANENGLHTFDDAFLGAYESADAYVEQLIDDLGISAQLDQAVPGRLRYYVQFDTAMLARDMQAEGSIHVTDANDGGVWIFDEAALHDSG